MTAVFLEGNSRDVLRGLPPDFFHCAVTSPPYFGLRRYDGGEEIWDGDQECEHEWIVLVKRDTRGVEGSGLVGRDPYKGGEARVDKFAGTCSKCGAWKGQLGAEPTPDLYISHLVQVCQEVKRVLRPDGVFWLNIGDSWAANRSYQVQQTKWQGMDGQEGVPSRVPDGCKPLDMVLIPSLLALALREDGWYVRSQVVWSKNNPMPESVNGWRWERHKVKVGDNGRGQEAWRAGANKTPQQDHSPDGSFQSSAVWRDCSGCSKCSPHDGYVLRKGSWRPTDSYEIILMLAKAGNYYCDREAVLEQGVYPAGESRRGGNGHKSLDAGSRTTEGLHNKEWIGRGGRNLRSVWEFPTKPYSGAHFAVFPPRLPELCIKSSTSEKGCCPECGAPWARVIEKGLTAHDGKTETRYSLGANAGRLALLRQAARERGGEYGLSYNSKYKKDGVTGLATQGFQRNETIEAERERSREEAALLFPDDERAQQDYVNHIHDHGGLDKGRTVGWKPTCSCSQEDPIPCRVLDPFSGAGTTALVAEQLGLDSFSIDTSAEYIKLAKSRLAEDEQKRIDQFIKQARKNARISSKC